METSKTWGGLSIQTKFEIKKLLDNGYEIIPFENLHLITIKRNMETGCIYTIYKDFKFYEIKLDSPTNIKKCWYGTKYVNIPHNTGVYFNEELKLMFNINDLNYILDKNRNNSINETRKELLKIK